MQVRPGAVHNGYSTASDGSFIMPTYGSFQGTGSGKIWNLKNSFNLGQVGVSGSLPDVVSTNVQQPAGNNKVANTTANFVNTFTNLWAYPASDVPISGLSVGINELRLAVVTQMYYEALARGGSRYEEQIQQFFGVTNPDSRIQHPEYLGGRRMQVNVHEVTNTAQSEKDFLGDVGAQSVTAGSNSDFTKSFTEHGWLIGLAVVRYEHSYSQGLPKKFARSTKFDFYNPLFARIGEQPVYNYEIFSTVNSSNPVSNLSKVFGYQEAWASYRYNPNRVSGRIRPNVRDGFGHWTLDDNYATLPTLSSGWISEDKGNLDRVLAVTSTLNNQIFGDFYFNCKFTRVMPMYSVPGAIGQF